jgi:hypothetical protein
VIYPAPPCTITIAFGWDLGLLQEITVLTSKINRVGLTIRFVFLILKFIINFLKDIEKGLYQ